MKLTTMSYGQFLVHTPDNFTGMYFADSVNGLDTTKDESLGHQQNNLPSQAGTITSLDGRTMATPSDGV